MMAATPSAVPTGLQVYSGFNTIVSDDRIIPWQPGIPGGIPTYPEGVNVKNNGALSAVGDGVADDYRAITNAIAKCPDGKAVYFPPGNYKISKQIIIQGRSVVLRGAGADKTRFIFTDTSGTAGANIYFKGSSGSKVAITSGYSEGSRVLTLSSTSAFSVGDYVKTEQDNDPAVMEGNIPGGIVGSSTRYQSQFNQVVAKTSTTITLRRPLYCSYKASMNPKLQKMYLTSKCGLENVYLDQRGTRDVSFGMFQTVHCWGKGIESSNANWMHVSFDTSYGCEIRSNFLHHAQTYGQGGYGVAVALSTDCLVEDNILYYLRHCVTIQNGAVGTVVAYNYSHRVFDRFFPDTDYLISDIEHHGGHPHKNLVEGNVCAKLTMDNYWGSSRHNTLFRNHVERYSQGLNKTVKYGVWAIQLDRSELYHNILGNVLCRPGDKGQVTYFGYGEFNSTYDSRVTGTMIYHGNFDYVSGRTQWQSGISNKELPPSLYLAQKPAYFGNLAWPPFGPGPNDTTPQHGTIPARERWIARFGNP